jgi:hypothetical protein
VIEIVQHVMDLDARVDRLLVIVMTVGTPGLRQECAWIGSSLLAVSAFIAATSAASPPRPCVSSERACR